MYRDLDNYAPSTVDYVLDEEVKEIFPLELDFKKVNENLSSVKDTIKFISEEFTATFPDGESATRLLDRYEIDNIREEYCVMQERELPQLQERFQELKQQLKDADDALKGKQQEINRYASEVRAGVREIRLKTNETFQIALNGYYLTYTYDRERKVFVLAKAFEIPDRTELWANEDKNRAAMLSYFDIEYPEAEKPVDEFPFG